MQGFTGKYPPPRVQGYKRVYRGLQEYTRVYRGLQGHTKGLQGMQGYKKVENSYYDTL